MSDGLTRAEVDASVISERVAEQGAASLLAWVTLLRGLELPESASVEEAAAAMRARGFEPDEAMDWLVACGYELNCFRQEMFLQMREAEERSRARRAMTVLTVSLVGVAGFALWAWRR